MRGKVTRRVVLLALSAGVSLALLGGLLVLMSAPGAVSAAPAEAVAASPTAQGPVVEAPVVSAGRREPRLPNWVQALMAEPATGVSADGVQLTISASTSTGSAYNSETLSYTLTVTNTSSAAITLTDLTDVLPLDALENPHCTPNPSFCNYSGTTYEVLDPIDIKSSLTITVPRFVSWKLGSATVVTSGGSLSWTFAGRLVGQSEGTPFTNRAFLRYNNGSKQVAAVPLTLTARTKFVRDGEAAMSQAATWLSQDVGGTFSTDWGDFDHDGALDLAVGSTAGTTVYRNQNGRLVRYWGVEGYTLGVRWVDVDGDSAHGLELVAVGDCTARIGQAKSNCSSSEAPDPGNGVNYVYKWDAAQSKFTELQAFESQLPLLRVEAFCKGDDGCGPHSRPDLLATVNSLASSQCSSLLYFVNGQNGYPNSGECIQREIEIQPGLFVFWNLSPAAALAIADADNDGDPEVALAQLPGLITITDLATVGGPARLWVHTQLSAPFMAYDLAWGDYDGDGLLDLAAAFPIPGKATIYRNEGKQASGYLAFKEVRSFAVNRFGAPEAVSWGDFNGDGRLDLAVGDSPRVVHLNDGKPEDLAKWNGVLSLSSPAAGQLWSVEAADARGDGSLDLVFGNRDAASSIYSAFAVPLLRTVNPIANSKDWDASSVAWGDVVGDRLPDLLFGGGQTGASVGARIFENIGGKFTRREAALLPTTGFGPHSVAFADLQGAGALSAAVGTGSDMQIYTGGEWMIPHQVLPSAGYDSAWADFDGDGRLDLLAGTEDAVMLYRHAASEDILQRAWTDKGPKRAAVAWGDFDRDGRRDIAAISSATTTAALHLYRNTPDGAFPAMTLDKTYAYSATTLAAADYNGDGRLDLAVGGSLASTVLLENLGGWPTGRFAAHKLDIPGFAAGDAVTGLDWGDVDNDGDLDLAAATTAGVKVFANLEGRLVCLWQSPLDGAKKAYMATGVAWGDADHDGDLDLAFSHSNLGQPTGYFENKLNEPVPDKLTTPAAFMALPNNPPSLVVDRPGATHSAYLGSAAEILGTPNQPVVTITLRVNDFGTIRNLTTYAGTDSLADLVFVPEYSLDGGATYQKPKKVELVSTQVLNDTTGQRLNRELTYKWWPDKDKAISDDARFRVTAIRYPAAGPTQSMSGSAVSPPFRVRGTTCVWPKDPKIVIEPLKPGPSVPENTYRFRALIAEGSGQMFYVWDVGDGSDPVTGPMFEYTYRTPGNRTVRVTITSEACPKAWSVSAQTHLIEQKIYFPMVRR